ncbi:odorant receptor 131-2-like [Paramisgurnus dabryanus]|uniref:odorant receptor 131-2-like n=1 Tax=Paramisgurnus dabryanus TaxID=90735 RepID=UPI003CCEFA76
MDILTFTSPLTLTAMSLERYVAICMPLRHSELSSVPRSFHSIIIIHAVCSIEPITMIVIYMASVPQYIYLSNAICQIEVFVIHSWQYDLRVVMTNMYFVVMFCAILFSYVKITQAAKHATSADSKSAARGLKTVMLHGVQMLLSLVQLWCPFVEESLLDVDIYVYMEVRYFNYVVFMLSPRCLCPLVYGLRDEKLFMALKHYAFCALKKVSPQNI